jgi:HlyD family secretion protein
MAPMTLCYTALSPFCRKVRMAIEYKGLSFELAAGDHVKEVAAFNPRAEVPMLIDGTTVVCNSSDILGYLDRKFPLRPLYPLDAPAFANVREWERLADTHLDAILTVIGNWKFADLPPMPEGLHDAARRDANRVYDQLQEQLATKDFICGDISAADFSFYPQVSSGAVFDVPLDRKRHADVLEWLKRMRARPEGQSDLAATRDWWAKRERQTVDTERVNWGTFRLEWLLANGHADWFADQVRQDKVSWSVGPNNNARHNPYAPVWLKLLVCCFVVGLGTWSSFVPLESAAIAFGTVESESSRKTIQYIEGGIIREILVADGDVVRAGQILISLEDTKAHAEAQSLKGQLWDATAREARLQAEQHGEKRVSFPAKLEMAQNENPSVAAVLAGQQSIFETRRQVFQSQAAVNREKRSQAEKEIEDLRAQASVASKRIEIVREEADMVATLVSKGLERRPRLLNLEREMADIEGRRGEILAQISRAEQIVNESQATLLKLENDRQIEIAQSLREAQNQILQIGERLQAADDQLLRTAVKAPEDGVVTNLRIHTPGGMVGAGAPLMDLVPRQDRLIVTARVRPDDIDVVRPGLSADVNLLPNNQRRVPRLTGTVTHVSADRLLDKRTDQPYYATKIRVQDPRIAEIDGVQITPGMPAQVFIKTGRGTVALYALRPLLDSFNNVFHED